MSAAARAALRHAVGHKVARELFCIYTSTCYHRRENAVAFPRLDAPTNGTDENNDGGGDVNS